MSMINTELAEKEEKSSETTELIVNVDSIAYARVLC
jgi:hypothetical protein